MPRPTSASSQGHRVHAPALAMKQAIGGVLKHLTLRPNIRSCRYVLNSGQSAVHPLLPISLDAG